MVREYLIPPPPLFPFCFSIHPLYVSQTLCRNVKQYWWERKIKKVHPHALTQPCTATHSQCQEMTLRLAFVSFHFSGHLFNCLPERISWAKPVRS